jgi:hypothetical protein
MSGFFSDAISGGERHGPLPPQGRREEVQSRPITAIGVKPPTISTQP